MRGRLPGGRLEYLFGCAVELTRFVRTFHSVTAR